MQQSNYIFPIKHPPMQQDKLNSYLDLDQQSPALENHAPMLHFDKQPSQIEAPLDMTDLLNREDHSYHGLEKAPKVEPSNAWNRIQGSANGAVVQYSLAPSHPIKRKCICKKTMCLKMYCECFNNNIPCNEECLCIDCKNTPEHQQEILEAKLNIREKGAVGLHNCNLSEKKCNCMKSKCRKKYCECFNSGVLCTEACKCVDCQNNSQFLHKKSPNEGKAAHPKKQKKIVKAKKTQSRNSVQQSAVKGNDINA